MVCEREIESLGIFSQAQNQLCTPDCPSYQGPWKDTRTFFTNSKILLKMHFLKATSIYKITGKSVFNYFVKTNNPAYVVTENMTFQHFRPSWIKKIDTNTLRLLRITLKNNYLRLSHGIRNTYIRKLSGLMSLWMKFLLWMYSILDMSWSANNNTVLRLNLREQKLNRSSRLGPSSSITITLKSPSDPHHFMVGIPTPPCIIR